MTKLRDTLQRAMTRGAGVVRSADSIAGARAVVEDAAAATRGRGCSVGAGELANLLRLADALLAPPSRAPRPAAPTPGGIPRDRPGLAPSPGARPAGAPREQAPA